MAGFQGWSLPRYCKFITVRDHWVFIFSLKSTWIFNLFLFLFLPSFPNHNVWNRNLSTHFENLGQVQTPYFTWAESNANEKNPLFSLISIRFGWCEVRRLNLALSSQISVSYVARCLKRNILETLITLWTPFWTIFFSFLFWKLLLIVSRLFYSPWYVEFFFNFKFENSAENDDEYPKFNWCLSFRYWNMFHSDTATPCCFTTR